MFNRLILLTVTVCTFSVASAQHAKDSTGTIRGTIFTATGSPAADVAVKIKNSRWETVSNEQGQYIITNVKPGSWTLVLSNQFGIETKKITIKAGKTTVTDFVMNGTPAQLKEISSSSGNVMVYK